MAGINKPTKPTDLIPRSFGGTKNNFDEGLIESGYEPNVPQTYNGDNLNFQLNATGQELEYNTSITDYICSINATKTPIVDLDGKLNSTQIGIKVYNASEKYYKGEWVKNPDSSVGGLYESLVANNVGNALNNTNYWLYRDFDITDKANQNLSNLTPAGEAHFANPSLSNLNATGQNILDNKLNTSQITNCILESPKMVDLTLDGTNLTYKANSRAIFPYGTSAPTLSIGDSFSGGKIVDISWDNSKLFYIVEYSVDKTRDLSSFTTGESMLYFDLSGYLTVSPISFFSAGATATTNRFWYDTTTNFCKWSSDGSGTFDQIGRSLPFAIIGRNTTNELLRIKELFQNVGYIGNWGWVNKGVKCLAPDGRNNNGTLKNLEFTTSKINVQQVNIYAYDNYLMLYRGGFWRNAGVFGIYEQDEQPDVSSYACWYSPSENIWRFADGNGNWSKEYVIPLAVVRGADGVINNFNVTKTFKAVDYNEMLNGQIPTIVESYKNGASWYRIWSDGWCEQGGKATTPTTVTFLKSFKDTNYFTSATPQEDTTGNYRNPQCTNLTKTNMYLSLGNYAGYVFLVSWEAKGYIF